MGDFVRVDRVLDTLELGALDVVLDLGCGDGRWLIAAALRGCPSRGFDLNEDLLEQGRRHATEAGVSRIGHNSREHAMHTAYNRQQQDCSRTSYTKAFITSTHWPVALESLCLHPFLRCFPRPLLDQNSLCPVHLLLVRA